MQQEPGAPHAKRGPRVFMDYTQAELDAAYDQAMYAPNREQMAARRGANCALVRARLGEPERFAYGPTEIEKLDVFRAASARAPIYIFIHGGAWRTGLAKEHCYAAEMFVLAGVHFVVPDFVLCQDCGKSLLPMADQVRRAIAWVWRNAERIGGDRDRIYLGGHSSGSHLGGCALVTDWVKDHDVPPDIIKGAVLCSGMYDLAPVRLSARSNYVNFTDEMVEQLSAARHLDRWRTPVVLAHGTLETPEFQRQSRDFNATLQAAGKPSRLLAGEHYNHFEIAETLANPFGVVGRAALDQMGIRFTPA